MSNNSDLIKSLEQSIEESQKNIRVLNAVKDTSTFIVVAVNGNSISSTSSDGMTLAVAVSTLTTAIRSYSEKLDNPEDIRNLLDLAHKELDVILQRAMNLEADEDNTEEYVEEVELSQDGVYQAPEPNVHPMDAPSRKPKRKQLNR